jgi:hypothetical protein
MSRDQLIDQSATSIQSLLNTNGATFLMTSQVRLALWTLTTQESVLTQPKTTLPKTQLFSDTLPFPYGTYLNNY